MGMIAFSDDHCKSSAGVPKRGATNIANCCASCDGYCAVALLTKAPDSSRRPCRRT